MMLWGQEGKQLWRTPLRTLAVCLSLALITGTYAIAYGLQQAAAQMNERIEAEYNTVAYVPSTPAQYLSMKAKKKTIKKYVADGYISDLLTAYEAERLNLQVPLYIDVHSRLMAYDSEKTGAISRDFDMNKTQNTALFAVRCIDSYVCRTMTRISNTASYGNARVDVNEYMYHFEVEKSILLHEDFDVPSHLTVSTTLYNRDPLTSAVEIGECYLIWGYYEEGDNGTGSLTLTRHMQEEEIQKDKWESDGMLYIHQPSTRLSEFTVPFLVRYSGSPEECMAQDTDGMWENLFCVVDRSQRALQILSADHPYALMPFLKKNAALKEGEFFSAQVLESGAAVAMISDILAEKNGLGIGDTLELSFFETAYSDAELTGWTYYNGESMLLPKHAWGDYKRVAGMPLKTPSEEDGTYTIVGIYSTDGWVNEPDHLHPNTVIVPQAALSDRYPINIPQFDYTIILPNGGVDTFEEELAEAGYGGRVHYFDQGYSSVIPGVETICRSAEFVYRIVSVLWMISAMMILLLFVWFQMPTGRVKYRLGTGKARIWGQMSFSALLVLLLSCLGGFAGSVLLYDRAIEWMMRADFTTYDASFSTMSSTNEVLTELLGMLGRPPEVFARVCAVQLLILFLLAVIFAAVASLRKRSFKR